MHVNLGLGLSGSKYKVKFILSIYIVFFQLNMHILLYI